MNAATVYKMSGLSTTDQLAKIIAMNDEFDIRFILFDVSSFITTGFTIRDDRFSTKEFFTFGIITFSLGGPFNTFLWGVMDVEILLLMTLIYGDKIIEVYTPQELLRAKSVAHNNHGGSLDTVAILAVRAKKIGKQKRNE